MFKNANSHVPSLRFLHNKSYFEIKRETSDQCYVGNCKRLYEKCYQNFDKIFGRGQQLAQKLGSGKRPGCEHKVVVADSGRPGDFERQRMVGKKFRQNCSRITVKNANDFKT